MELTFLGGDNFSGRTQRLKEWVGIHAGLPEKCFSERHAYIPPDPAEAFSGLAPTVATELELSAADRGAQDDAVKAIENLGFGYVLGQNPFTLSGGEQAVVAIISAAAFRPRRLAVDGTLEQLSAPTRLALIEYLTALDGAAIIVDNRLAEWWTGLAEEPAASLDAPALDSGFRFHDEIESPEIELVDISFAYPGGRPVFDRFNLKLGAGKPYALRGPNGAGKTTMSKLLCGLLKPSSGEIRVNGRAEKPWKSPGTFASYHFQNPAYQLFGRKVRDEFFDTKEHRAAQEGFGLSTMLDTHPLDLPYVLRKRVAIASAALRPPRFLILDEPTLGQDATTAKAISCIFRPRGGLRITHSQTFSELACVNLQNATMG